MSDFQTADDGINVSGPPRVNPVIPNSVGGLLAEEWTIDPNSTLPSYLERMMMDEARRSGLETLKSLFAVVWDHLARLANSGRDDSNLVTRSRNLAANGGGSLLVSRLLTVWSRFVSNVANLFDQRIFRDFGPELRLLLIYALERRSLLSSQSATISEALYGGKRVQLGLELSPASSGTGTTPPQRSLMPMSKQNAIRLALLLSLGPYLEERSGSIIQTIMNWIPSRSDRGTNIDTNTIGTKSLAMVRKFLTILWPLLRMTIRGTFLLYQWKYLLGRTAFFDPYSHLLNLVLRRVTMQDQQQQQPEPKSDDTNKAETNFENSTRHSDLDGTSPVPNAVHWRPSGSQKIMIGLVSSTAIVSWMARVRSIRHEIHMQQELRQRGEEQPQSDQDSNHANGDIAATTSIFSRDSNFRQPPPPIQPPVGRDDKQVTTPYSRSNVQNVTPRVCPLCQEPRINPTASTGGYVFCLKCLLNYIRHEAPACPVTGKPCPESSIIRLYEPRTI